MIVRIAGEKELCFGFALEEFEHPRSLIKKGFDRLFAKVIPRLVAQIGDGGFARVVDPRFAGMRTTGNPKHPPGIGGGSTQKSLLLDYHRVKTTLLGGAR